MIRDVLDICSLCFETVARVFVVTDIDGLEVVVVCIPCMVATRDAFAIDQTNYQPPLRIVR